MNDGEHDTLLRENASLRARVADLERLEGESRHRRDELQFRVDFERLVIGLSERLINLRHNDLDGAIDHALASIGRFSGVDRSYVFQFGEAGDRVSNTHEWCARDITPAIADLQDLSVDTFPWIMSRQLRGEAVHIPRVADLPPEAERERREFEREGIQSLVCVPLRCAGRVSGFIGFDSVRLEKTWDRDTINLLKIVGEMIAGALERRRVERALVRRVGLEKLVASVSSHFINLEPGRVDQEIDRVIRAIGEYTGVDRSYLFRFAPDRATMDNTHEWCAPGIKPHRERLQGLPVAAFGYAMGRMSRGEVFLVNRVSDLPEEAASERREFEREGIATLINVPIMVDQTMIGFLGLDADRSHRLWSEQDGRLLRLIGEVFANALGRRDSQRRLEASLREKEVLLKEVHHRVKNNMQVIHGLLYLQAAAIRERADPVALEAFEESQGRIRSMAMIHDRLYRSGDLADVSFEDYLRGLARELTASYAVDERVSIEVAAGRIRLSIDQAIPCGLIVNELVTNSLKHAFPGGRRGAVRIALGMPGAGVVELRVEDDGIGIPEDLDWRHSGTLGLHLVHDLVGQLGGEASLARDHGTRFQIRFEKGRT